MLGWDRIVTRIKYWQGYFITMIVDWRYRGGNLDLSSLLEILNLRCLEDRLDLQFKEEKMIKCILSAEVKLSCLNRWRSNRIGEIMLRIWKYFIWIKGQLLELSCFWSTVEQFILLSIITLICMDRVKFLRRNRKKKMSLRTIRRRKGWWGIDWVRWLFNLEVISYLLLMKT